MAIYASKWPKYAMKWVKCASAINKYKNRISKIFSVFCISCSRYMRCAFWGIELILGGYSQLV